MVAGLILVAGAAGGTIASNIPEYENFDCFSRASLKVLWIRCSFFNYQALAHTEHLAFWSAVVLGAYAFLTIKQKPPVHHARRKE
jgi:hypothetical protein